VAATLLFVGAISMFYLWKPVSSLVVLVVRTALRLDGNPRAQLAAGEAARPDFSKTEGLGNVEEAVMSKWAGADEGASSSGEEEESEEGE
jgi:hypothetical protein